MKYLSEKEIKRVNRLRAKERSYQKKKALMEKEMQPILDELERLRLAIDHIEFD